MKKAGPNPDKITKRVPVWGAKKWWPMMVHKNGFHESFFHVTAQNI